MFKNSLENHKFVGTNIFKPKRMIHFFGSLDTKVFAVQTINDLSSNTITKLQWLFGDQPKIELLALDSNYVGPRAAMITPWSTNAVEITQNMGIEVLFELKSFIKLKLNFRILIL